MLPVLAGAAPAVAIAPASLSFAYQVRSPYSFPQAVLLSAGQTMGFTATRPVLDTWVVLPGGSTAASGQIPGLLAIAVDPTNLGPGTYTSRVTIQTSLGSYDLPVSLLVTPTPVLLASPAFVEFSSTQVALPQVVGVGMSNLTPAILTTSSTAPWLTAVPGTASVTVGASAAKASAGLNSGAVKVAAITTEGVANSPLSIPVVYIVGSLTSGGPLSLDAASLHFDGSGRKTVAVTGPAFTASTTEKWLQVLATGGAFTVWANSFRMAAGTYQATVVLQASGVVELLPVTMTVAGSGAHRPR
jgi:hypothetical protein